jgi:hypothetical protein
MASQFVAEATERGDFQDALEALFLMGRAGPNNGARHPVVVLTCKVVALVRAEAGSRAPERQVRERLASRSA